MTVIRAARSSTTGPTTDTSSATSGAAYGKNEALRAKPEVITRSVSDYKLRDYYQLDDCLGTL